MSSPLLRRIARVPLSSQARARVFETVPNLRMFVQQRAAPRRFVRVDDEAVARRDDPRRSVLTFEGDLHGRPLVAERQEVAEALDVLEDARRQRRGEQMGRARGRVAHALAPIEGERRPKGAGLGLPAWASMSADPVVVGGARHVQSPSTKALKSATTPGSTQ